MELTEINLFEISSPKQWKNLPSNLLTEEGYTVYGANGIIGKYIEYTHKNPAIAITCRGATSGNVHLTLPKSFITSNAMVLDDLDSSKVYINFLYYYLKNRGFNDVITGSAQPQITRESLKSVNIKIPISLADQIRIANVLGKIEEVIQARKNAIDQLDELVKATFYDMFDFRVNKSKTSIENLAAKTSYSISSGPFGSSLTSKDYKQNGVLVLRGKNVSNGKLNLRDTVYVSHEKAEELKRSRLQPNDIVIIAVGSSGYGFRIPESIPEAIMSQNFNKITPNLEIINPIFFQYLINSQYVQKQFSDVSTNAGRSFLSLTNIKNIEIPLFDINIQNQFASIAEKIEKLKDEQEKQLLEMEDLYASVSHAAFSGALDLSRIPYDESLLPFIETEIEPVVIDKKKEEEILKSYPPEKIEQPKASFKGLTWDKVSFEQVASSIKLNYEGYYFTSEMLLNFLTNELGIQVYYFTSAEAKKNPQLLDADDFYIFIQSSITSNNPFLDLEQVFYDAEEENIKDISFRETDLEQLSKKEKKERSGIYFRIKDETTTR